MALSLHELRRILRDYESRESAPAFIEIEPFFELLEAAGFKLPQVGWSEADYIELCLTLEARLGLGVADHDFVKSCDKPFDAKLSMPVVLIADHLRSAMNVGSIIRSLDFFAGQGFAAVGYTPMADHPLVAKTALGAERTIKQESFVDVDTALSEFKSRKFSIVALETSKSALPLERWTPTFPLAIVLGHERNGLALATLKRCDDVVCIAGYGSKNSLNVAVTAGIVLQHVRTAWQKRVHPTQHTK